MQSLVVTRGAILCHRRMQTDTCRYSLGRVSSENPNGNVIADYVDYVAHR
jgi:hypothetical protein